MTSQMGPPEAVQDLVTFPAKPGARSGTAGSAPGLGTVSVHGREGVGELREVPATDQAIRAGGRREAS